jgi:hypothetical protein
MYTWGFIGSIADSEYQSRKFGGFNFSLCKSLPQFSTGIKYFSFEAVSKRSILFKGKGPFRKIAELDKKGRCSKVSFGD